MTRYLLFLPLLLSTFSVAAQANACNISIRGRILDLETKQPVPFAAVGIEGVSQGTSSDEEGYFLLEKICPGEIDLQVAHVAYKTLTHHHDTYHREPVIYLAQKSIELSGLVVEESVDLTNSRTIAEKVISLDLQETTSKNLGDLTRELSGVSMLSTGPNLAKPMVHGLHSNRVLVINNGTRHVYQAWGREHAPEIDAAGVGQIRLVKGAGTVRYGPDALGGVILYDAPEIKFDSDWTGDIRTAYETNGRAFTQDLNIGQGFHRFAWNAGFKSRKQGDLMAPDYMLTNTGSKETGFDFRSRFHRESFDLELYASNFQQNLGILRGSVVGNFEDLGRAMSSEPPQDTRTFSYQIRNPRQETNHSLYQLKGAFYWDGYELNAQYAFQQNLRKEFDIRRGTNNSRPSIDLTLNSQTLDLDFTYPSERIEGVFGVQGILQDNNNNPGTNTIPFVPNFNTMNVGVYTIQRLENARTTYEVGARYDYQFMDIRGRDTDNDVYRNELTYHNVTFLLGTSHKISNVLTWSSNLSTAWRPPNVGELYSFGKHQFNFEYGIWRYELDNQGAISTSNVLDQAGKKISSERGIKWINELSIKKGKWSGEAVFYVNEIAGYFFLRPYGLTNTVRGTFPYFIWDQTRARLVGMDLDVRVKHTPHLESELKAAYVLARDVNTHQVFLEVPPFNGQYRLSVTRNAWSAGVELEYMARQGQAPEVISTNEIIEGVEIDTKKFFDLREAPAGYFLLNADVSFKKRSWSVRAAVENVLNESYRTYTDRLRYFADNPGLNVLLGVSYEL